MKPIRSLALVSATCLLLACGVDEAATTGPIEVDVVDVQATTSTETLPPDADITPTTASPATTDTAAPASTTSTGETIELPGAGSVGVDIVLGEWALVPSAQEAPPGNITFRFRNLGTVTHALRIRTAGSGKDRLEWRGESVSPGQTALLVADLPPGTYEIDCPVEDTHGEHDQLGMEMTFTVQEGAAALAPLEGAPVTPAPPPDETATEVSIAQFAFEPAELAVTAGSTVTWKNSDPAPHTVTGDGFDTGVMEQGASGSVTFNQAGTFDYFCAIHPSMQGRVVVAP